MFKKIVISLLVFTVLIAAVHFTYWKTSEYIIIKSLEKISSFETVEQIFKGTADSPTQSSNDNSVEQGTENTSLNVLGKPNKSDASVTFDKANTSKRDMGNSLKKLSPEDRAYVMEIYSRYSGGEIAEVSGLVSGEMTPEKKKRIKEIVFSKMSRAEYNHLCELANKYGY